MTPLAWAALAVVAVVLTVLALRRGDRAVRWVLDDMDTDEFLDAIAKVKPGAIIRESVAPERAVRPARVRLHLVGES